MARVKFGIFGGEAARGGRATMNEATVSRVTKKVGDAVEKGECLAVIENDKTTVELCAPVSGVIAELFFDAREEWNKTGEEKTEHGALFLPALGIIETEEVIERSPDKETGDVLLKKEEQTNPQGSRIPPGSYSLDSLPPLSEEARRIEAGVSRLAAKFAAERNLPDEGGDDDQVHGLTLTDKPKSALFLTDKPKQPNTSATIPRASPAARHKAHEHDIDLSSIVGTDPEGEVQVTDIERAIGKISLPSVSSSPVPAEVEEKSRVRILKPSREVRTLALNLERGSKSVIAAGEMKCSFPWMNALRQCKGPMLKDLTGVSLRPWTVIAHVVTHILRRKEFWVLNGYWKEEVDRKKDTVNLYTRVHLGIAYDKGEQAIINEEQGTIAGSRLKILTLSDADSLGVRDFFLSLDELLSRARKAEATARDLSGHTFIVNNIGALGFERGFSLMTPGISGLLNLGKIHDNGEAVLQLFFDHRMCDGSLAKRFLEAVIEETNKAVLG